LEEVVLRSVSPFANTELWVLPFPARHALSTLSRWNWRHGDDISYGGLELPHKKPTLNFFKLLNWRLRAEFVGLGSFCPALFDVSALNAVVDRDSPRLVSGRAASESTTTWFLWNQDLSDNHIRRICFLLQESGEQNFSDLLLLQAVG